MCEFRRELLNIYVVVVFKMLFLTLDYEEQIFIFFETNLQWNVKKVNFMNKYVLKA